MTDTPHDPAQLQQAQALIDLYFQKFPRIRKVADATAESIQKVNAAIQAGGEAYFRYRQIEMLPTIGPAIAAALAQSKMITLTGGASTGDGAPETTTHNITQVIQTVLAAQMVAKGDLLGSSEPRTDAP